LNRNGWCQTHDAVFVKSAGGIYKTVGRELNFNVQWGPFQSYGNSSESM
jgi:hypothetical protein